MQIMKMEVLLCDQSQKQWFTGSISKLHNLLHILTIILTKFRCESTKFADETLFGGIADSEKGRFGL